MQNVTDLEQQTERTVQDAREYAESIVETLREPLIVLDADLKVISANRTFYQTFKTKPEETEGKLVYDIGNQQWNIPKLRELLEEILPKNTSFDNFEVEHDFPHLGKRIMLLNARRIPRPPAKPRIMLLAFEDITERKRVEALRETNQYLENLLDYANAPIIVWNPQFAITRFNHAFESLTGRSANDVIGKPLEVLFPPDSVENSMKLIRKTQSGERMKAVEIGIQHLNGSIRTVLWNSSTLFATDGKSMVATIAQGQDITKRKKAEEEYKSAKSFLDVVVDSSPFAMWISDREGLLIRSNRSLRESLNLTDEQLVGKYNVLKDVNLEMQGVMPLVRAVFEKYTSARFIIPWNASDAGDVDFKGGRNLYIDVSIFPIQDNNGTLTNVVCQWVDITGRKQAEDALASSEQFLNNVIEQSPVSLWISDSEGTLIKMNQTCRELFGVTDEEAVGKYNFFKDNVIEEQGFMPLVKNVFEKREIARFTINYDLARVEHIEVKEGTHKILEVIVSPIKDIHGKITNVLVQHKDITERKKVEEALRESEEKFRNLVENASIGIFRTKIDGSEVLDANPKLCDMLGLTREEFVGQPSAIAWANPERREEMVRLLRENGSVNNYEIDIRTKSGEIRTVIMSITAYPKLGYLEGGLQDITERKLLEEESKRYSLDLAKSNQDLQQFAYIASHDLQEPLRMIASYLQMIEKRYKNKLDKDVDDFINFAVGGAVRMQDMINGLLLFSRVESRGKPFESVDTEAILKDVLANLAVTISENKAVVTHDYLPSVMADPPQFNLVFQNLIVNAIKFHGEEAPRIHLSAEKKEKEWVFSVKDNGLGIDPQYNNRVFVMFQRLGGDKYPGIGLGLTVCKRIVERHGGHIWFESKLGKGTNFYFTVPIKNEVKKNGNF